MNRIFYRERMRQGQRIRCIIHYPVKERGITMKIKPMIMMLLIAMILMSSTACRVSAGTGNQNPQPPDISPQDDLIFIHHSCGQNWLNNSLHAALLAKDYIDERNDITYGTTLNPDNGRNATLGGTPGDNTDMNHWILWFNDYLNGILNHGCANGENKIVMFKSCYPANAITGQGVGGDPFSGEKTSRNYRAVFTYADGATPYTFNGKQYQPLEIIFSQHPNTLFIFVTAPPLCWSDTNTVEASNARKFYTWLKDDWLVSYNTANPGLNNVAIYDWFDFLAYDNDHATHPNMLKNEYGGNSGDSHPNALANQQSTIDFCTGFGNFLDAVWEAFTDM